MRVNGGYPESNNLKGKSSDSASAAGVCSCQIEKQKQWNMAARDAET